MLTFKRLATSLLLSFSVAACGASGPVEEGGPGFGDDGPPPNPVEEPTTVIGEYAVSTHYELSASSLGFADELEDLAQDPLEVLSDQIAAELSFDLIAPAIEQALEDFIPASTLAEVASLANELRSMALEFDVLSTLEVTSETQSTHQANAMEVDINGEKHSYSFDDGMTPAASELSLSVSRIGFGEHDLVIPYTQMMEQVINNVIIPQLDPGAQNLGDALNNIVDCNDIAQRATPSVQQILSFVDADDVEGWCESGLDALGDKLFDLVANADVLSTAVGLTGDATFADENGDGKIDRLQGNWSTTLFGETLSAEFSATRTR